MAHYGLFRRIWLTRFSQPARERPLYRHSLRSPPKRILELGLGPLVRTERLLGLVPGNVDTSLSRLCNHLGAFDLVLLSAENDARHLDRCWFFIQRLVHAQTTVFAETSSGSGAAWSQVSKARVDEMAARTVLKRAG